MTKYPFTPRHNYYPFGSSLTTRGFSAGTGFRFGFNGKEFQGELDARVYNLGSRLYNPSIGQFMSVDPKYLENIYLGSYSYYKNCPILLIDFEGEGKEVLRFGKEECYTVGGSRFLNKLKFYSKNVLNFFRTNKKLKDILFPRSKVEYIKYKKVELHYDSYREPKNSDFIFETPRDKHTVNPKLWINFEHFDIMDQVTLISNSEVNSGIKTKLILYESPTDGSLRVDQGDVEVNLRRETKLIRILINENIESKIESQQNLVLNNSYKIRIKYDASYKRILTVSYLWGFIPYWWTKQYNHINADEIPDK